MVTKRELIDALELCADWSTTGKFPSCLAGLMGVIERLKHETIIEECGPDGLPLTVAGGKKYDVRMPLEVAEDRWFTVCSCTSLDALCGVIRALCGPDSKPDTRIVIECH